MIKDKLYNRVYKLLPFEKEVIDLYESTKDIKLICNTYGCTSGKAVSFLKKRGYEFSRKKYKLNSNYFDNIDTEDKAYFLGFLYADGNHTMTHSKKVVRISINKKDREILEKFNLLLNHEKPIRVSKKDMVELEIADQQISKSLFKYGMMPNKTFQLKFPEFLDYSLRWHFIRGYFDGDGGISIYRPKKMNRNTISFNITGTIEMCTFIQDIFKQEINVNSFLSCRFPERNNNNRTIQVGGNLQTKILLDKIYKNATIYLERKYKIYRGHYYDSN